MIEATDVAMKTEQIADGVIVRLAGEIDLRHTPSLQAELAEIQRFDPPRLIIDFAAVTMIDSSVVATLVGALRLARRGAGILILCGLSERLHAVFELTRLDKGAFTIVDDTDEAIALANRRKFGRFRKHGLECDLGQVLDLAAGGVRIMSRRRLKRRVRVRLWNDLGEIAAEADVCWTKRHGFRRHEVGLRFVNLGTEQARTLSLFIDTACETSSRFRPGAAA